MNWTVIITACIVFVIFAGPFYLVSRRSGSKNDMDGSLDVPHQQEKPLKHPGEKFTPKQP